MTTILSDAEQAHIEKTAYDSLRDYLMPSGFTSFRIYEIDHKIDIFTSYLKVISNISLIARSTKRRTVYYLQYNGFTVIRINIKKQRCYTWINNDIQIFKGYIICSVSFEKELSKMDQPLSVSIKAIDQILQEQKKEGTIK